MQIYSSAHWCTTCLDRKFARNRLANYFVGLPKNSQLILLYDCSHVHHRNNALWVSAFNLNTGVQTVLFFDILATTNYIEEIQQILTYIEHSAQQHQIDILLKVCDRGRENKALFQCVLLTMKAILDKIMKGIEWEFSRSALSQPDIIFLPPKSVLLAGEYNSGVLKPGGLSDRTPANLLEGCTHLRTAIPFNINGQDATLPTDYPMFSMLEAIENVLTAFSGNSSTTPLTQTDLDLLDIVHSKMAIHNEFKWATKLIWHLSNIHAQLGRCLKSTKHQIPKQYATIWPLEQTIIGYRSHDYYLDLESAVITHLFVSNDPGLAPVMLQLLCQDCDKIFAFRKEWTQHRKDCIVQKV